MWLILSKLKPRRRRSAGIPRQRLRRRLPALPRTRFVLLHAPAGFRMTCINAVELHPPDPQK